jgi:ABC-2 type transport system permease protein
MTTATMDQSSVVRKKPGYAATLTSEFTKLRSVRATYIQAFLAIVLALLFTTLIAFVYGAEWDNFTPAQQADFDPTFMSFFGTIFTLIVLVVLGVTFASSEYTSGMIRQTFSVTPRRPRILWSKAVIVAAVSLLIGLVVFPTFLVAQAIFRSYDLPSASLSGEALGAVVAGWLTTPLFPLLGLATAFILRSTAGAITTVLALIFAPALFGPLLPNWWQENVLRYLPGTAQDNLLMPEQSPDALTYLAPGWAVAVMLAWLVAFMAAAYLVLTRRDV